LTEGSAAAFVVNRAADFYGFRKSAAGMLDIVYFYPFFPFNWTEK